MSAPDFRAFRATVLEGLGELESDTSSMVKSMSAAQRLTQADADWNLDMLNAALAYMVEKGLFPDVAEAEDEIVPRAEAIQRERKAKRLAAAV
jgi:hypothetical protein